MTGQDIAHLLEQRLTRHPTSLFSDPEVDALAALGEALQATAPPGLMDPVYRHELRNQLVASNPTATGTAGATPALRFWSTATPYGSLYIAYSGSVVRYTDLTDDETLFVRECMARFGVRPERDSDPPKRLARTVRDFIEGSGRYRGPVDLSPLPAFQQRVLQKTLEIRRGEIRSYNWIAKELGDPKASRAVGTALARNPIAVLIPCHRVVRSDYHIGEYGCGGPAKKREILAHEGVNLSFLEQVSRRGYRFFGSSTTNIFCLPVCHRALRTQERYRVFFASEDAARAAGYRPCKICKPA